MVLVLGLLISSCSSWRVREKYSTREHVEHHQLEIDSVEMKWKVDRQRLQFSKADQQVVIWPKGEFRFDLDSGYRGEAVVVEVSRKVMDSVVEQEVNFGEVVVNSRVEEDQEEEYMEEFKFSEGESRVMWKGSWVFYLIVVGLVIFAFKRLKKS